MGASASRARQLVGGAVFGGIASTVYWHRALVHQYVYARRLERRVGHLIQFDDDGDFVGAVATSEAHRAVAGHTFVANIPMDAAEMQKPPEQRVTKMRDVTVLSHPLRLVICEIHIVPYMATRDWQPAPIALHATFPLVRYHKELHPDGTTAYFEENIAVRHAHVWTYQGDVAHVAESVASRCVDRQYYERDTGEPLLDMGRFVDGDAFEAETAVLAAPSRYDERSGVLDTTPCTREILRGPFAGPWPCGT